MMLHKVGNELLLVYLEQTILICVSSFNLNLDHFKFIEWFLFEICSSKVLLNKLLLSIVEEMRIKQNKNAINCAHSFHFAKGWVCFENASLMQNCYFLGKEVANG